MKKFILFAFCLFFGWHFAQNTAIDYMQQIESGNEKILNETWDYLSAIAKQKSARKIEKRRQDVEKSIRISLNNVKAQSGFNGNIAYRDSSIAYLKFNLDVVTGKAKKLIDMEDVASKSYDAMEAYILYQRELNKLLQQKSKMINNEQKKFAAANKINLVGGQSKLSQKIEAASKILDYKENLFLVFARCSMYEQAMLQSMREENTMFDYKSSGLMLAELSEQSKAILDTIKDINPNKSLRNQTQKSITFFKEEADKLVPAFAEFSKQKNDFQLYKNTFDQLPNVEKTKEKVAEFNKKINEINVASQKFNALLQQFNNRRSQIFNDWSNVADNFVESYMPK